ncbi:MAG TPA: S41 family peptidase, partial [Candidatus Polarisedimenticolaceae bacterium]|nr:S41 family peptidase [Candidatus Polarisedimenticolaceae bacterium]
PSLGAGRIAYQLGADLRVYDIASGVDRPVDVQLASDLDQTREKWVKTPMDYVTSSHLSPTGDRVAMTAYGKVFVATAGPGRLVQAGRPNGVRYRDARFFPDGSKLLALSTETGETEFVSLPANGVGTSEALSKDGKVLRWEGIPSPDGKWVAHHDKDRQLWLLDVAAKHSVRIDTSPAEDFSDLAWSPDSRHLVYGKPASNQFRQLMIYDLASKASTALTTDRYDTYAPAFSSEGRLLYFLSDRVFESLVSAPWGPRQPEPYFDRMTKIYVIALNGTTRSPFAPPDELHPKKDKKDEEKKEKEKGKESEKAKDKGKEKERAKEEVKIDLEKIAERLEEVPVPSGNYSALSVTDDRLYLLEETAGPTPKYALRTIKVDPISHDVKTFLDDVKRYELSLDRKKILLAKGDDLYVVDAGEKAPDDLGKSKLDLSRWTFPIRPREEWTQMFDEAWRLERDYFYDTSMHGVDWPAMREKFRPLVERVTTRAELSDVFAQMIGELSALHMYVSGGDVRRDPQTIEGASLGARFVRDPSAGGLRVEHIYRTDPDQPDQISPLSRPGVRVVEGDVIQAIDGVPVLSVADASALLRNKAGRQVLLSVKPKGGAAKDVIAVPITLDQDGDLRYDEWEYTRRLRVEERGKGKIGYVHLRAMNRTNVTEWYREFYPVVAREGLIVDVRFNRGGNIDSWILEKLMRPAWMYWQPRVGEPYWNMQNAFRGHAITLVNHRTASDGEAFAEGFRRLKLGPVIGTRTWGGEIWLSSSNVLADKGIATAAENGVYGPEGAWLIEGRGVEPDTVVDNLPRATFDGRDAQLDAAIDALLAKIAAEPRRVPVHPPYPDKSH